MLSNSCKYGIRAVTYISKYSEKNKKIGIKQISKDLDLPTPFLAKILQMLAKQKILSSSKGPHGGFSLARDPRKITLLDIVLSIDGRDTIDSCIIHNKTCRAVGEEDLVCPVHEEYSKIRTRIMNLFSKKNIYSMVKAANSSEDIII
jgi:Rrf2 family iron-sulfur cluster assembly transcriptional regulator